MRYYNLEENYAAARLRVRLSHYCLQFLPAPVARRFFITFHLGRLSNFR
jgi:hypothetical protein